MNGLCHGLLSLKTLHSRRGSLRVKTILRRANAKQDETFISHEASSCGSSSEDVSHDISNINTNMECVVPESNSHDVDDYEEENELIEEDQDPHYYYHSKSFYRQRKLVMRKLVNGLRRGVLSSCGGISGVNAILNRSNAKQDETFISHEASSCGLSSEDVSHDISNIQQSNSHDVDDDERENENVTEEDEDQHSYCHNKSLYDQRKIVIEGLEASGLKMHLQSAMGGELPEKPIATLLRRTADLLIWTYMTVSKNVLETSNVMSWLKDFLTVHFEYLVSFVKDLETSKGRSPATVLNFLNDLKKVIVWSVSFRPPLASYRVTGDEVESILLLIRAISRTYKKKLKKDQCDASKSTLAGIVFSRKLPVDGHKALVKTLVEEKPWIHIFIDKMKDPSWKVVDKDEYDIFLQIMFAAMYVFSPQGRVSGVASLTCEQGMQMLRNGNTLSSEFKTHLKYGYQPVTISGQMPRYMVEAYIKHVRPKITETTTESTPLHPLWLQCSGKKITNADISHLVKRFFVRTMQLNVTTTSIRKLVEMEMEAAVRAKIISPQERIAVQNINGHTSAVVQDFYLKLDRTADAAFGRDAFSKVFRHIGAGEEDSGGIVCDPSNVWPDKDELKHAPWGTTHPNFTKPTTRNMRVPWSHNEIGYIMGWIAREGDLALNGNRVARCLHYICKDSSAYPIFHLHHIMNSGRLRTGFDKAMALLHTPPDNATNNLIFR